MPRSNRKQSDANLYHVIQRGVDRRVIFYDDNDREYLLRTIEKNCCREIGILAWCFMSNHVHLLVRGCIADVSTWARRVFSAYATYFNKKYEHVGHLFQGRYLSEPINNDTYLMNLVRYIHKNPVKAGIGSLESYPWSSYREYLDKPFLSDTNYVLGIFGGSIQFTDFHNQNDDHGTYLEIEPISKLPDEDALLIAESLLEVASARSISNLSSSMRDTHIRKLRKAGFSAKQIARICGLPISTVYHATRQHS